MKKIISILSVACIIMLCLGLCACGGSTERETTTSDKVETAVKDRIYAEIISNYSANLGSITSITTDHIVEIFSNRYIVAGKVTVEDYYGRSYSGKYEAEVDYDPSTENCKVDLDLGALSR